MSVIIFDPDTKIDSLETIIMSAIFTSTWAVVLYILGELTYLMLVFGASTRLKKIRFCLRWVHSTLNNRFNRSIEVTFFRQRFLLRKGPIVQKIEINSKDSIGFVKRMGELYENVCEIVDDVNGIFSIHVRDLKTFSVAIFVFDHKTVVYWILMFSDHVTHRT